MSVESIHHFSHVVQPLMVLFIPALVLFLVRNKLARHSFAGRFFNAIAYLVLSGGILGLSGCFLDGYSSSSLLRRESACQSNLRNLGLATRLYINDYDERYPPAEIWADGLFQMEGVHISQATFRCPSVNQPFSYGSNRRMGLTYDAKIQQPDSTVMLFEMDATTLNALGGPPDLAPMRHSGSVGICFIDGHVKFLWGKSLNALAWKP